jgi:hypothetical protein
MCTRFTLRPAEKSTLSTTALSRNHARPPAVTLAAMPTLMYFERLHLFWYWLSDPGCSILHRRLRRDHSKVILVVNEIQIVKVEIDGGPCGPSAWEAEMSCRTYRDLAYEKEDADWRLGQYAPGIREIDLWIVRSAFLRTVMEAHRIDCPICQGK